MRDWPGSGLKGRGADYNRAPARPGETWAHRFGIIPPPPAPQLSPRQPQVYGCASECGLYSLLCPRRPAVVASSPRDDTANTCARAQGGALRLTEPMDKTHKASGQRGPAATGIPPVRVCVEPLLSSHSAILATLTTLIRSALLHDFSRVLGMHSPSARAHTHACLHARAYTGITGTAVAVHRSSTIRRK